MKKMFNFPKYNSPLHWNRESEHSNSSREKKAGQGPHCELFNFRINSHFHEQRIELRWSSPAREATLAWKKKHKFWSRHSRICISWKFSFSFFFHPTFLGNLDKKKNRRKKASTEKSQQKMLAARKKWNEKFNSTTLWTDSIPIPLLAKKFIEEENCCSKNRTCSVFLFIRNPIAFLSLVDCRVSQ